MMSLNPSELIQKAIKYLIEGIVVALACFFVSYGSGKKSSLNNSKGRLTFDYRMDNEFVVSDFSL